ncbi:MAG TPA: LuxR C-terminal-related transcriptional regulator [Candidatus Dormibacteraeota bacterium]|nr:LuxR C-terminal-related transcriptional regulator [Candidatus Dormibacteraeota bacterium]
MLRGPPRTNLPAERSSFVGRRRELRTLAQLLASSRLVTLVGPGGVGKTRLALRAASRALEEVPDGVWLVELGSLGSPALLQHVVATQLGLRPQASTWLLPTLIDALRDRELLLVLDNCEHLIDACAALTDVLLARCPRLRVLATSRQPLHLEGESVLVVPPLDAPESGEAPNAEGLWERDAVRLFVTRARDLLPDFQLTPENASAVADVCRRLDGLPLALELAAVCLPVLGVEGLCARLDDRFQLLSRGRRSTGRRQRTLRAVFDWSYELLDEPERVLWRRLAVFPGSFDLEAAEAVCGGDPLPADRVMGLLLELVDRSLVSVVPDGDRMRYRLLETVRAYCLERLRSAGEEGEIRNRHLRWYAQLSAAAGRDWLGPRQGWWLERLEREVDNLRAALEHVRDEDLVEVGLEMASDLWLFWYARGRLATGQWFLRRLLEAAPGADRSRARALANAAYLGLAQGDRETAAAEAEEALGLARAAGDPWLLPEVLVIGALAARAGQDRARAEALLREALDLYRAQGRGARVGVAVAGLGSLALEAGDDRRALALQAEAEALHRAAGDDWNLGFCLFEQGVIHWHLGDLEEARRRIVEALSLRRRLDDHRGIASCLDAMAWLFATEGEHERAARWLGAADAAWRAIPATIAPQWQPYRRACETACRRSLGAERFRRAQEWGRNGRLDDLLAELADPGLAVVRAPEHAVRAPALSPRELQVARLVARGLTNKEIARRLGISPRTAETHVEHILSKLALSSRAQIGAWVGAGEGARPSVRSLPDVPHRSTG